MILSVCPNTALDKVMFIEEWKPGTPMRIDGVTTSVGGKGLNSAVVLRHLGVETVGIGFFAGEIGRELLRIVEDYGIIPEPIWVDGTNRIAHVIAELKTNIHSHVIAGNVLISEAQKQEFLDKYQYHLQRAQYVIFGGSLPPSINEDFYCELITLAQQAGVPTLIDSQKQAMIEAIKSKPDVVKMNWEEFEWTFDLEAKTIDELVAVAYEFYQARQIKSLVLTLGKKGILSISEEGIYLAKAPLQKPLNAAGAGDAVSSTLAWRFVEGDDWEAALRWACAVSAASVLTERTGDVFQEDIVRICPQVSIEKIR